MCCWTQEKAKELKKEAKLAKQLQEMELNILFNEGISNQFGKKKSTAQSKASALGLTESNSKLEEFLEAISSESENDSDDDNYYDGEDGCDGDGVTTMLMAITIVL